MQGLTHCHIAWILLHGGRLDDATGHVERALTFLEGQPASRVIALATRARIELARGHVEAALADAEAARVGLAALDRVQEGESLVLLTWAEALDAAGRTDEAHEAIVAARRSVGDRSQNIEQPELRASFRHAVPENARILALARAWERAAT
ncbi:MAG: hypothetical protein R3A51_18420 [Nannocystaceae bacterium]